MLRPYERTRLLSVATIAAAIGFWSAIVVTPPDIVFVVECSTDQDCEEKNPHLSEPASMEASAPAARVLKF